MQPDLHRGLQMTTMVPMSVSMDKPREPEIEGRVRIGDRIKAGISLFATLLPLLERSYPVLPVGQRIRGEALPAAVLASLLCVIAGYATARHSARGLAVGWTALILFLSVLVALLAFMDLIPRGERGLYVLCFALFALSAASFLSIRHEPESPRTDWRGY